MSPTYASLIAVGFLLGWSVAWPPGPINAEIARRSSSGRFASGVMLLIGASSGDAIWALGVSLGVGLLFTNPTLRLAMGVVSIGLLIALAFLFLRGAWRALSAPAELEATAAAKPEGVGGAYALGAAMALTSPWNVAFWLAAMGRPELAGADAAHLLAMAGAVIAGANTWGLLWAGATAWLHRGLAGAAKRWWTILVDAATGALMLYFAYGSAARLLAGS